MALDDKQFTLGYWSGWGGAFDLWRERELDWLRERKSLLGERDSLVASLTILRDTTAKLQAELKCKKWTRTERIVAYQAKPLLCFVCRSPISYDDASCGRRTCANKDCRRRSKHMKEQKFLAVRIAATVAACLLCWSAPGEEIRLAWDYPPDQLTNVSSFYAWSTTNATLALTNWTVVSATKGTNVTLTVKPGQAFYAVSASNMWGNFFCTNVVNTPPVPFTNITVSVTKLR